MASIITFKDNEGKKRYKVTYELPRLDGMRHRKSKTFPYGTKYTDVVAFKRQKEVELATGEFTSNTNITLTEYVEKVYFPVYTMYLSPTTVVNYKRLYDSGRDYCVKERFGSFKLKDINRRMVQEYVNLLSTKVGAKTIREYIYWLHSVFDTAISEGIIKPTCNPTEKLKLPPKEKPDIEPYTLAELQLMLAESKDDRINHLVIGLAGLAGLRRGEIMGLRWSDVDLSPENPVLHIRQSRVYSGGKIDVKSPKTKAGIRDVPIPKTLADILRQEQLAYKENKLRHGSDFNDSGYVVVKEDGTPRRPGSVSDHYECFVRRMGREHNLPFKSLHKLRHTYATLLIDMGANPKTVQKNLGHEDVMMTLGVYAHAYESRQRTEVDRLDSIIRVPANA